MAVIDNKKAIAMSDEGMEAVTLYTNDMAIVNNFASLFGALWTEKDLFQNLVRTKNALSDANTQLIEENAKLEENDALQKEFINIAAHELRTPV